MALHYETVPSFQIDDRLREMEKMEDMIEEAVIKLVDFS